MAMATLARGARRMLLLALAAAFLAEGSGHHAGHKRRAPPPPQIEVVTASGPLAGRILHGGAVHAFLGVPFAEAPMGDLRFAPPVPVRQWQGTRSATQSPPVCVQRLLLFSRRVVSEDCLYLNVFTPGSASDAPDMQGADLPQEPGRPVLVYFHGGSFQAGAATSKGSLLARATGAVVVAPQYRLGIFGFFSPEGFPANFGMQDQQLALQWVQENIAAFGGDPRRVLIFGCSAGGAAVAGHLVLPRSHGLYSAAAMESPGGHKGWVFGDRRLDDDWVSEGIHLAHSAEAARHFGCDGPADLACMRGVDSAQLLNFSRLWRFAPALPGTGLYPLTLIRQGYWSRVPLIVGGTSCESCADARPFLGFPRENVTDEEFRAALAGAGLSGGNASAVSPDMLEEWYAYRVAMEGRWRTFARILSDSNHACSAALTAEAAADGRGLNSGVWRYMYAHTRHGSALPGSTHCSSDYCLFNQLANATAGEHNLMRNMALWWTQLADSGSPNGPRTSGSGMPEWLPYAGELQPSTMLLDTPAKMGVTVDTQRFECEHWKRYLGWFDDEGLLLT